MRIFSQFSAFLQIFATFLNIFAHFCIFLLIFARLCVFLHMFFVLIFQAKKLCQCYISRFFQLWESETNIEKTIINHRNKLEEYQNEINKMKIKIEQEHLPLLEANKI